MPIAIYDKSTDRRLFEITEEQLQQLIDALEEEDAGDRDYFINAAACDFLEGEIDPEIVAHLRAALPPRSPTGGAREDHAAGTESETNDDEEDDDEEEYDDDEEDEGIEIQWRRE